MNHRFVALPHILTTAAIACALAAAGCSKKEPAPTSTAASQAAEPKAPAESSQAPAPAPAPAAQKADPLKSMMTSARQEAEDAVAQTREKLAAAPAQTAAPAATTEPAPAAAQSAPQPALPAALTSTEAPKSSLSMDGAVAALSSSSDALQKQAEELLTRYSGELDVLKNGMSAVKSYVDQHPDVLPEGAQARYAQLKALVPELESLVGTLKDYRSADLTTLVPKLQKDFASARSLYSEVRALLPESL